MWKWKCSYIAKAILESKDKVRNLTPSDFKIYCEAVVVNTDLA